MSWVQLTVSEHDVDRVIELWGNPQEYTIYDKDQNEHFPQPYPGTWWLEYDDDTDFSSQADDLTGFLYDNHIPFELKWNEIDGLREAGKCAYNGHIIDYVRTDMHHQIVVGLDTFGRVDRDEIWVARDFLQRQKAMPQVFLDRKPNHAQPQLEWSIWEDIPF